MKCPMCGGDGTPHCVPPLAEKPKLRENELAQIVEQAAKLIRRGKIEQALALLEGRT